MTAMKPPIRTKSVLNSRTAWALLTIRPVKMSPYELGRLIMIQKTSFRLTFQGAKVMLIDFNVPGKQVYGLIKKNQTFWHTLNTFNSSVIIYSMYMCIRCQIR